MRSTRENLSTPAAGKTVAAPATLRASDSLSCLGQGADPSILQRAAHPQRPRRVSLSISPATRAGTELGYRSAGSGP